MKNRIVTIVSMIFLAVLCFGGCGNTELEERNFPLAAAVTLTKENYQMAFARSVRPAGCPEHSCVQV